MSKKALKDQYQNIIDWNVYRVEQSQESLNKLIDLLPKLGTGEEGDVSHQQEIVEMHSLALIYETGIRNMEGKVDKYKKLLEELE